MATTHFPTLSSPINHPLPQSHHFRSSFHLPTFRTPHPIRPPTTTILCSTNGAAPSAAESPDPKIATSTAAESESGSVPEPDPLPFSTTLTNSDYPIEKRRPSQILRERKKSSRELLRPSGPPPNYEIGWRRTKEIKGIEKPVGYAIMDFLEKLEVLITGKEFGSTELLAKVGEIVAARAREEAELLMEEGKVEERMVTELGRVLRLMEMDLAMVKAAVKDETLKERLEIAKARCRQAILVAGSF